MTPGPLESADRDSQASMRATGESADGDASGSGLLFLVISNYVRDNSDMPPAPFR